jgi:hypothetical protein
MDSSRTEVCSGDEPCLEGMMARAASFSTCAKDILVSQHHVVLEAHTAISKSTIFSAKVLISLLKQNLYSPGSFAVNTKSPCRSLVPSSMTLSVGPTTE